MDWMTPNKTIKLRDILWLHGDAIIATFEVKHTTAIYPARLRMSDQGECSPTFKIDLFMVAPDEHREKVAYEISQPTVARTKFRPCLGICRFIPKSCTLSLAGLLSPLDAPEDLI